MNINRALVTTQQLVYYVTVCFWTMLFGPLNLYVSYYRVVRLLLSLGTLVLSFSPYLHVGDPMFTLSVLGPNRVAGVVTYNNIFEKDDRIRRVKILTELRIGMFWVSESLRRKGGQLLDFP